MREIRFRAWNPDNQSMSPSTTLQEWIVDATKSAGQFRKIEVIGNIYENPDLLK